MSMPKFPSSRLMSESGKYSYFAISSEEIKSWDTTQNRKNEENPMVFMYETEGFKYFFDSIESMRMAFDGNDTPDSKSLRLLQYAVSVYSDDKCLKNRYISEELAQSLYKELDIMIRNSYDFEMFFKIGK